MSSAKASAKRVRKKSATVGWCWMGLLQIHRWHNPAQCMSKGAPTSSFQQTNMSQKQAWGAGGGGAARGGLLG